MNRSITDLLSCSSCGSNLEQVSNNKLICPCCSPKQPKEVQVLYRRSKKFAPQKLHLMHSSAPPPQ